MKIYLDVSCLSRPFDDQEQSRIRLELKPADALHLAAAEEAAADVLLSCDDRFCRTAQRQAKHLRVPVRNPLNWLSEIEHGADT